LAGGAAPEMADTAARLADLARRLDDAGALFVLDDLHRLPVDAQRVLVVDLSRALGRGRWLATTRHQPPDDPAAPDRVEVRPGAVPLPHPPVLALLAAARARTALRTLTTRMIVEVDAAGACSLHDLFREAALRGRSPAERAALHAELARVLDGAPLDPVVRA